MECIHLQYVKGFSPGQMSACSVYESSASPAFANNGRLTNSLLPIALTKGLSTSAFFDDIFKVSGPPCYINKM